MNATRHLNMTQTETMMETQEHGQRSLAGVRSATNRARTKVSEVVARVPEISGNARHRAGQVAERLPGAFGRVRSGAESSVTELQRMPDSRLRMLAAVSIGFGAGLRLAGASRLATFAGFAPASILGFAIISRPRLAPHPAR